MSRRDLRREFVSWIDHGSRRSLASGALAGSPMSGWSVQAERSRRWSAGSRCLGSVGPAQPEVSGAWGRLAAACVPAVMRAVGPCRIVFRVVGLACLLAGFAAASAWGSAAGTLYVSVPAAGGSDSNPCSQALPCATISRAVSLAASGDEIVIGAGTFTEHVTVSALVSPLTFQGAGMNATIVSGGFDGSGSVFTLAGGASATIEDLAITGGQAGTGVGGGVYSAGDLTMIRDQVLFNSAVAGGGIYGDGSTIIDQSAIFGNQAAPGGGGQAPVALGGGGAFLQNAVSLTNDLISHNTVIGINAVGTIRYAGGGVYLSSATGTLSNDTITANEVAAAPGSGDLISDGAGGGGFVLDSPSVAMSFDTIADNGAASGGGIWSGASGRQGFTGTLLAATGTLLAANQGGNCVQSGFTDRGYNLEDDAGASCGFSSAVHDIVGEDPLLGPLAGNGGLTQTLALSAGSPALGVVPAGLCPSTDQRGLPRPDGSETACDIGAYEYQAPLSVGITTLVPGAVGVPYSAPLQGLGGTVPYTWSVLSGRLPRGLSLSSAGVISGTPRAARLVTFTVELLDSSTPTAQQATQSLTLRIYPRPQPAVWVGNGANSDVNAFSVGTSGNRALARLSGMTTGLEGIGGLAVDRAGELYVASSSAEAIDVFAPGASGNIAPSRVLQGPDTGIAYPLGVALDSSGRVYVSNYAANSITVYAPGASGDAPPLYTIAGADTGLSGPWGITIDGGDIWVANSAANTLDAYTPPHVSVPGSSVDAVPVITISPQANSLDAPAGLGQNAAGDLLVANQFGSGGSVSQFAHGLTGGAPAPILTINAGLQLPKAVDTDTSGNIYVAGLNGLNIYPAANPHTSSPTTINGASIDVVSPGAVAVAPPMTITMSLPTGALARRYSGRVFAILARAPVRWRLAGHLPPGLTLDRAGQITGTPRRTGRYRFTLAARDAEHPAQTAIARVTMTVAAAPTLASVRPAHSPHAGGQTITITGTRFATSPRATTVTFGKIRAPRVTCPTRRRCALRTPPHSAGRVPVTVTVNGLTSQPSPHDFTYTR
jgi:hypothetical protein